MFKDSFREISAIQAIICNDHPAGKDELITTLDGEHLQLTIAENEDDIAKFILNKEGAQNLVDWFKVKDFVV